MTFHPAHTPTPVATTKDGLALLDWCVAVAESIKLLLFAPLAAGFIGYGIASVLPKTYTSVVYLALNDASARSAETLIRSPAVLGVVEKKYPDPIEAGAPPEARSRSLNRKIRMSVPPGEIRKTAALFRLEVDDPDPARAQAINAALIDTWLDAGKPKPVQKARLEDQLARTEAQLKSVSGVIERLEKETTAFVVPGSLQGELATPLVGLNQQRARLIDSIVALKVALEAGSRDVIISPPSLPVEHSWPPRGLIAALTALSTGALLLVFVLLRQVVHNASAKPEAAAKLARISAALRPWRRGG